jgi:hypothetical protein
MSTKVEEPKYPDRVHVLEAIEHIRQLGYLTDRERTRLMQNAKYIYNKSEAVDEKRFKDS